MKGRISPLLSAGLLIFVLYVVIDRFIVHIPNGIAITLLLVAIALIIAGGYKAKKTS